MDSCSRRSPCKRDEPRRQVEFLLVGALLLGLQAIGITAPSFGQPANISDGPGLFVPVPSASGAVPGRAPVGEQQLPAGVLRFRRAAIDFGLLEQQVAGFRAALPPGALQSSLILNLFDDVVVPVVVDTVEPAVFGEGYVVSGTVDGGFGEVVLAVHPESDGRGFLLSGSATTAAGNFRIEPVGAGLFRIDELDPSVSWGDEVRVPPEEPSPGLESFGLGRGTGDPGFAGTRSATSQIDVVVLYTPAAVSQAGGEENLKTALSQYFAVANRTFRNSNVAIQLDGWAGAYSYIEPASSSDPSGAALDQISADGTIDQTRAANGADLVHLFVSYEPTASTDGRVTCGVAWAPSRPSPTTRATGFGVTLLSPRCGDPGRTFAHEIGHNLGLSHDRYVAYAPGNRQTAGYPYGYGHSNAGSFSPVSGTCWYTVMGYDKHCIDVPGGRAYAKPVYQFSDPNRRHPSTDEPLGVFGTSETYRTTGPANAVQALELNRAAVAAYFDRPDPPDDPGTPQAPDLTVRSVSATPPVVDEGGRVTVEASVANVGGALSGAYQAIFFSRLDDDGADWQRVTSLTSRALSPGSSDTLRWRGTVGTIAGHVWYAVCAGASNDASDDNGCAVAPESVVVRDPDEISGATIVAEQGGTLQPGKQAAVEYDVNRRVRGGDALEIQSHWFLLSYEPVDAIVWGGVWAWYCFEEDTSLCWQNGSRSPTADWDWNLRSWGFGAGGSLILFQGLEAYDWSGDHPFRFAWQESTPTDVDPTTEFTYSMGVVQVEEDDAAASSAAAARSAAPGSRAVPGVRPFRGPPNGLLPDAFVESLRGSLKTPPPPPRRP